MKHRELLNLVTAAAVSLAVGGTARAEAPVPLDPWFEQVANLNRPQFAEPAGSHGAAGLAFGGGVSRHQAPSSAVGRAELGEQDDTISLQRIWLVKGLPIPVDLLFTGGQGPNERFTQATGAAQWNVFEQQAMPAIAIRASIGGLFGAESTEAQTRGLELAGSYGIFGRLVVFGSTGILRHDMRLHVREDGTTGFLLEPGDQAQDYVRRWQERSYACGARLVVLPPFVAVTGELHYSERDGRSGALKLSFGI